MNKAKGVLNVVGWACIILGACIVGVGATHGVAWVGASVALVLVGMLVNMIVGILPKTKRPDLTPDNTYQVTLKNIETGMVWNVMVKAPDADSLVRRVRNQYETDYIKPLTAVRVK